MLHLIKHVSLTKWALSSPSFTSLWNTKQFIQTKYFDNCSKAKVKEERVIMKPAIWVELTGKFPPKHPLLKSLKLFCLGLFLSQRIYFAKVESPNEILSSFLAAFMKPRISVLGHSLRVSVFKSLTQRVIIRDQSTVGQAAPNTEALRNPVSLMQDLKNTSDSGISRPWKLWVLLKLGTVLDLKNLQSLALNLWPVSSG